MVWFIDGITQGEGRAETADFHQLQAVRAYWEAMRKPGHLPRRDDINPRGIASALEQVFLVEQIAPHHGRLRLAGMALSDLLGMDPRGMPVWGADDEVAGTVQDLWLDRSEMLFRYIEVRLNDGNRTVLLPVPFARITHDGVKVHAILGHQFTDVPGHKEADQVTMLEEEKIAAYYGAGTLYATPERQEPLF